MAFAARLEVVAGNAVGMSILVDDELVIGRQAEGAGRLADDDEISRSHARVSVDASGFGAIEDLGSTNGTFVNGLRISTPTTLSEGDTIELGATTLVVRELPTPAPEPARSAGPLQPTIVPGAPPPVPEETPAPPPALAETPAPPPLLAETPVPPPGPLGEPAAVPELPILSLRLEVDFSAREACVRLDGASEPVRFRFDAGAWRSVPSEPAEHHDG